MMICFSLLGGWCIKGIIKNPTPTPKYRKKRKQTVKLSVQKQTNGEFVDCVIYQERVPPFYYVCCRIYALDLSSALPRLFLSCFVPAPPPSPFFLVPITPPLSCSVLTTLRSPLSLLPPYSYFSLRSSFSFAPLSPHSFSFHSQIAFPNM